MPCQPAYVRPAHFDLPSINLIKNCQLNQQQSKQFNAMLRANDAHWMTNSPDNDHLCSYGPVGK
jgi:hypothetical protein